MKNLKDFLNITNVYESLDDASIQELQSKLNEEDETWGIVGKNIATLNKQVLKKVAGYLVEQQVKTWVSITAQIGAKTYEDGDQWYDFVYDGQKCEIKAFQKGRKYSNTKLTANQLEHKDELLFVLCEYTSDDSRVVITNIELVPGKDMKISGNRMVKK